MPDGVFFQVVDTRSEVSRRAGELGRLLNWLGDEKPMVRAAAARFVINELRHSGVTRNEVAWGIAKIIAEREAAEAAIWVTSGDPFPPPYRRLGTEMRKAADKAAARWRAEGRAVRIAGTVRIGGG